LLAAILARSRFSWAWPLGIRVKIRWMVSFRTLVKMHSPERGEGERLILLTE
jgi:hypothetical protein